MALIINAHWRETIPLAQLTTATPEIQRCLDLALVDRIVAFQQDHYSRHGRYLLMGNIDIARVNGNDCIVNGQHRAAAYNRLPGLAEVPVEIYEIEEQYLVPLYKVVNSATPNNIAVLTVSDYKLIDALEKWLVATFPSFVKRTDRPVRPSVSLPRIKKILETRKLPACDLVAAAKSLNDYYATLSAACFGSWGVPDAAKTIELCKKKTPSLYFSLYHNYEWVDRVIDIARGKQPQDLKHVVVGGRIKISKALRQQVWGQPLLVGACRACGATLNYNDFECGHIVAVAHGGETVLSNLVPVCRPCNQEMGTMHMDEWVAWLKYTRGE
jgi:hypothetical protein